MFAALLAGLAPALESAELQLQFKSWAATCGGARYCTAATRLRSSDPQLPYAFRLRVSRYASGDREIVFLPARDVPAADAQLSVRVDRKPAVQLAPGSGYRAIGGGNTYVVADADSTAALIEAMRAGKRVEFSYRSAQGKPITASFSLDGFAPALAVVDPRPARRAQPAPAPTPEPAALSLPGAGAEATVAAPQARPDAAAAPSTGPTPAATPATVEAAQAPPSAVAATAGRTAQPTATRERARNAADITKAGAPPRGRKRMRAVRQFACVGNEPAWNLTVDNDKARFELLLGVPVPEGIALSGKLSVTGEGYTPDMDWRGKATDGRAYRALIQQQRCSNGVSDVPGPETMGGQTEFEYRVQLTVPGGRVLLGCCNAGLEPQRAAPSASSAKSPSARTEPDLAQAPLATLGAKSPVDWSRMLLELMPAIDACLESTPGVAPYVTKAWQLTHDLVSVRTRNATVGWFECIARSDGRAVETFRPVESTAPVVPGEEVVLFTPATQTPPAGNCFTHERVVGATGNQIGWLSTNTCATQSRAALTR